MTAGRSEPLSATETYKNRYNLIAQFKDTPPGRRAARDLHRSCRHRRGLDRTPHRRAPPLRSRACDDKAQIGSDVGANQLFMRSAASWASVSCDRVYQFVIDEEMGGNGALSP
jgi:hypothetical protein